MNTLIFLEGENMGKYGNGISFAEASELDREEFVKALKDAKTPKSVINKVIDAYDEVVYQAQSAMSSGRALNTLLDKYAKGKYSIKEFVIEEEKEKQRDFKEFKYHYRSETDGEEI